MLSFLRTSRIALVGVALTLLGSSLLISAPVLASQARQVDATYRIEKGQTVTGNLYLNASDVVIDGTLNGDLVAAAKSITINGTVTGSLLAASPDITVNGTVEGSVRTLSQHLILAGTVGTDVTAVSDRLEERKTAVIGDSLYFVGNTVQADGQIKGDRRTFLSSDLPAPTLAEELYAAAMAFLGLALLGLVVYSLEPQSETRAIHDRLKADFWKSLLVGVGAILLGPIAVVLLLISSIGRPLGILLLAGLVTFLTLGLADAAFFIGRLVLFRVAVSPRYESGVFLLGALLIIILSNLGLVLVASLIIAAALGNRLLGLGLKWQLPLTSRRG
ncbi:MAG: polymer-forming cytoskeletal protein [bacterium]